MVEVPGRFHAAGPNDKDCRGEQFGGLEAADTLAGYGVGKFLESIEL
jgi:hypothetical protein